MIDTNHRPDPQANDNIRPKLAPDVSAAMAVMQARIGFKYGDLDLFRGLCGRSGKGSERAA